ncbi:ApbE family protein [Pseudomonas sp. WN033]|nr:ApbE family protein [Pseudomonas sp. WN033]
MVWVLAFLLMSLIVAGMAVGVMMGRKPIAGSCGGIGATGVDKVCGICGGDTTKCEEVSARAGVPQVPSKGADLARDATKVD